MHEESAAALAAAGIGCAACAAAGGLAFGALAAPRLAGAMLSRKRRQLVGWWHANLQAYEAYREKHGHDPSSGERGSDGAVGIWLEDARRQFLNGKLTSEQARDLERCGALTSRAVGEYLESPRRSEADDDRRYASATRRCEAVLSGLYCAAGFAVAAAGAVL